jgi:hypothetical protein
MAYTYAVAEKTVFGNQNIIQALVTADAATGAIVTGLGTIAHVQWSPKSATTAAVKFAINAGVSGTSTVGTLAITGAVSGDEFFVTIFGR